MHVHSGVTNIVTSNCADDGTKSGEVVDMVDSV